MRLRHACSLRRHAPHDSAARDCTSEREENCFDSRLMSDVHMRHGRVWSRSQRTEGLCDFPNGQRRVGDLKVETGDYE